MPFPTKKPPICITVTVSEFNNLLEFISTSVDLNNLELCKKCNYLKEKLLKYSYPCIIDGEEVVELRFFINEIADLVKLFVCNLNLNPEIQYYTVLLNVRKKLKL